MVVDPSWKGVYKAGGLYLFAAGFIMVPYFLALLITQTSPTLNPQMVLDNPVPAVPLFALAAFGELLLMPGMLGLYYSLKDVKKTHMLMATALWLVAVISFLVSRGQILSILPISGSYQATTSETLRAAYLVSTEHAIELGNVFAEMALMFFSVSSIIIGARAESGQGQSIPMTQCMVQAREPHSTANRSSRWGKQRSRRL